MLKTQEAHKGLSIARVMELTSCCRNKARKILRGLVGAGVLAQIFASYHSTIKPIEFYATTVNHWFKESGHWGWLYSNNGIIMCRTSNEYTLLRHDVIAVA